MKKKLIVLIDKRNRKIGLGEKIEVHRKGKLHRAFSIFIFNSKGELLLQQRAKRKYHSPLLWSATTDGHPLPNEKTITSAKRRLKEEMGIICPLKKLFSFFYKERVGSLIENEYDYVFVGKTDKEPKINPREAKDYQWISLKQLEKEIKKSPDKYTVWLKIALPRILKLKKKIF